MTILGLVVCFSSASAEGIGVGMILGEPTGLCGKVWIGNRAAFDAAVAWSFSDESAVHIHADYLLHTFDLISADDRRMPVYYGIGARLKLAEKSLVGVRIPVGSAIMFDSAPLDVFLEIVPLMDLVPDTEFNLNGSIGIRYYF
jgi:hypothetical protein